VAQYGRSVSQLSTASSDHGSRLATIEGANYATTSELSLYVTATSLSDTNTTVGGINTRVNTLENAGHIATPALQAHSYATTADLSNYALASSVTTNSRYLSGVGLPAIAALQAQVIPTTSSILNNTNVGATASSGSTAGVTVVNKASPATGVDFNLVLTQGIQDIQGIQEKDGADATSGTLTGSIITSALGPVIDATGSIKYSTNIFAGGGLYVTSDERIKKEINRVRATRTSKQLQRMSVLTSGFKERRSPTSMFSIRVLYSP
jgi:hypothetical protein